MFAWSSSHATPIQRAANPMQVSILFVDTMVCFLLSCWYFYQCLYLCRRGKHAAYQRLHLVALNLTPMCMWCDYVLLSAHPKIRTTGAPVEGELSDCGDLFTARVNYHLCAKDNGGKCQTAAAGQPISELWTGNDSWDKMGKKRMSKFST